MQFSEYSISNVHNSKLYVTVGSTFGSVSSEWSLHCSCRSSRSHIVSYRDVCYISMYCC